MRPEALSPADGNRLDDTALLCSSELLELHLLATEQCNFRCVYCYEDFALKAMGQEVVAGIKHLIDRRAQSLEVLNISWFGGEPLAAKGVVLEISTHAAKSASAFGFRFDGSMTTNGSLLDSATASELAEVGVRTYQVTLDGPREVHDRVRVRRDGQGTFDAIWSNLKAIVRSDLDIRVMVRLHIRPNTVTILEEWLPELWDELLADERFSLLVKPVERLGGPNDGDTMTFESNADRHAAVSRLYDQLPPDKNAAKRRSILQRACYAGRPHAWVIRSNGMLARCTVALDDPRNAVGKICADGRLQIDQSRLTPWFAGVATLDPAVLGCPLKHIRGPDRGN